MLSRHDDYPIHQTPEPLAHASTSDRNFYDRYWFNGFSRDGDVFFGVALGLYPNRSVMDAAFSVVREGRQYALHASRLAPSERGETCVGPLRIEVLEPMRILRVCVEPNGTGLECDLVFRARTVPVEEPRVTLRHQGRVLMDSTRFTQFGSWTGSLAIDATRIDLAAEHVLGTRDRSWGIRPVGERVASAPVPSPQFFWLWTPLHFEDHCILIGLNEAEDGGVQHANGVIIPAYRSQEEIPAGDDPRVQPARAIEHRVSWAKGTRRAQRAKLELTPQNGSTHTISLEPMLTFQMLGLGYLHPEWGHGMWKGEEALAGESWELSELNPLDPRHIHVQQLCRARMGKLEGIGVLEQLVIGPHRPSGFTALFDGAT